MRAVYINSTEMAECQILNTSVNVKFLTSTNSSNKKVLGTCNVII